MGLYAAAVSNTHHVATGQRLGEAIAVFLQNSISSNTVIEFILSMLPIIEGRYAAFIGITFLGIPPWQALVIGFIGTLVPVIPLLFLIEPIRKLLSRIRFMKKFFDWLYERAYKKGKKVMQYGAIGLSLFVAVPLPVTGAWTGTVLAILFDIKPRLAIPAIAAGTLVATGIGTLAGMGVIAFL